MTRPMGAKSTSRSKNTFCDQKATQEVIREKDAGMKNMERGGGLERESESESEQGRNAVN